MKRFNIASLILAGLIAVAPAAFARGGGGGHGWGGGHFGSAGHFAAGHYSGGHGGYWHGGHWYAGWPWWLGPVGVGIDNYDYGYDDYPDTDNVTTDSGSTVVAVQRALENLGYYHGPIDGVVGPETVKAIRWFQAVDKLPVTGQIDSQMLKALWIS